VNSEISSNRAQRGGGHAVYPGIVKFCGALFLGNSADIFAADMYGRRGEISVYGCTFSPSARQHYL